MSRPATQDEYLASLVPDSVRGVSRRTLLRGALGAGTLLAAPSLLSACGGDSGGPSGAATGTVTLGSNQSDAVPKAAIQSVMDAFQKANSGLTVKINTIDHNSFQENINNYLQGSPDDVFTWFAGYRMQFFAEKGLAGDITDVWAGIDGMSDALKKASTGADGKQYFVPMTNYPWAVFYRKSVFKEKGYQVPKTLDELNALGAQMKKDGLAPIAFGDKDGWPAMGTFDQLNLRVNGYDYHVSLMAGEEAWNSDKVVVGLMVIVPTLIVVWLVWLPAISTVLLSFTNWDGIGPLSGIKPVGLQNYRDIATIYPPFWPAIQHNLIWLAVMFLVAMSR